MPVVAKYAHLPLSPKELQLLALSWQCMESVPNIDMDKLTELSDYNKVSSTKSSWSIIKAKLAYIAANADKGSASGVSNSKASIPAKKKKGFSAAAARTKDTPSKKRKTAHTDNEYDEDDDDDDDVEEEEYVIVKDEHEE